jgi:hypothetical protein
MTTPETPPADIPDWHVLSGTITRDTRLAPGDAGIVEGRKVTYQIDSGPEKGKQHTVFVPEADFTEAGVQEIIDADAVNAHRVSGLRRGSAPLA